SDDLERIEPGPPSELAGRRCPAIGPEALRQSLHRQSAHSRNAASPPLLTSSRILATSLMGAFSRSGTGIAMVRRSERLVASVDPEPAGSRPRRGGASALLASPSSSRRPPASPPRGTAAARPAASLPASDAPSPRSRRACTDPGRSAPPPRATEGRGSPRRDRLSRSFACSEDDLAAVEDAGCEGAIAGRAL